ncbi:MAG: protein kinase [Candidatus Aminicenantes bacterium]|nr:protein kinase [Candidatus Aminicenantes bacterium]
MAIKCPKCHSDNPETQKFCGECAAPLHPIEEISAPTETLEAAKEELTTGSTFADRYQIIEELGKGGMGKVYRAVDKKLNEEMALKLIKPEIASDKKTIARFSNELKLARKISHRNVGRMYELMEEEGTHFITMEYVPGEDLKSFIRRAGPLSAGKTTFIAKQVCEGLTEAHRLGVVHRDLKPQNIMIDKEGNARIMDFGIARSIMGKGITGAGVMIGTPEYMSPEQAEVKEVDQRSDIYSLGIILYEMVTGRVPFEGETPLGIAMKHKSEVPKDPKELNAQIPDDLSRVILRCLEKDKEERYQSAGEVRSELNRIEKGIPTTDRVIPDRRPSTSKEITVTFRKRWLFIPVLIAIVAAAALAILFLTKEKPPIVPSEQKMLVVLPFENLGSPEDEYFAEGLTEEITSRLAALHGLGVISRSSAIQYKKTEKTTRQIGEELGVDFILEGTVRWDKRPDGQGRVRVTPQLIRVSDDTQLWSERYDQFIQDIFAVQSEIAEQVIRQLDITVLEPERRAIQAKPTDNLEAYDYFLRASESAEKAAQTRDKKYLELAEQLAEKAVELDPEFTLAHIWLSRFHRLVYFAGVDQTQERLEKSKAAVDRALELEPELPEAHGALAFYYYQGFLEYDRAMEIFEYVQKARPNYPPNLIGYIQRRQGKWEQATATLEKAFKLDPRSSALASEVGLTYLLMRNYEKAETWFNRSLSIDPNKVSSQLIKVGIQVLLKGNTLQARALLKTIPVNQLTDYMWLTLDMLDRNYQDVLDRLSSLSYDSFESQDFYFHRNLVYASVYRALNKKPLMKQNAELVRKALEKMVREHPGDPRFYSALGLAYAYEGKKDDALLEGRRAVELLPVSKDAVSGPIYVLNLAKIYTVVGEYEEAINQLEYLLTIPGGGDLIWDFVSVPQLRLDPQWDPLRDHKKFQRLLK